MSEGSDIVSLAAEIVASYLSNEHTRVQPSEIPDVIRSVRAALAEGEGATAQAASEGGPAKPGKREITKSISPDALISFIDKKPYKTLKRHLTTNGMTMAEYRERYGLPADYPSVAPNYSAARSEMAKKLGLGARGRAGRAAAAENAAPKAKAVPKSAGGGRRKTAT